MKTSIKEQRHIKRYAKVQANYRGGVMKDKEMLELINKLTELPEYRRKEIAILLMSTTLNSEAVEQLAGFMVAQ